jgi:hypothetical protein
VSSFPYIFRISTWAERGPENVDFGGGGWRSVATLQHGPCFAEK